MGTALDILKDFPANTHAEWMEAVDKQLKGKPFEKSLVKKTYEGIDIQPMYFLQDLEGLPQVDSLPGAGPYARGTTASGNRVNTWNIAQEITLASPEDFNKAATYDLTRGQNSLNIILDKAALAGQDPEVAPELVGKGGLSLTCLSDAKIAFKDIDLTQHPIRLSCGTSGIAPLAMIAALIEEQGGDTKQLEGSLAVDPLGALAVDGQLQGSLSNYYDRMAQLTRWALEHAPKLRTIAINTDGYRNSGGSAVQDIGFALATGVAYIRELMERGLAIDDIASMMSFEFSIGNDFFMEIAKFRAARMTWAQVIDSFGGNENAQKMYIHARTATWNKTEVDPWVNMLRVSTEAFSGIAGGVDSLHVSPFDEIFRTPNEFSRRIARNVHIVLKEEGHLDKVVDPTGGCWYVEKITAQLAESSWALLQEVEKAGGMSAALEKGMPQDIVAEVAAKRAKNVATRTDRFVGTNMYPNLLEKRLFAEPFDQQGFCEQRVQAVKAHANTVDQDKCAEAVAALGERLSILDGELVVRAIQAARQGATIGMLSTAIAGEGNETLSVKPLHIHRGTEPFERVRRATEAFTEKTGATPKLFLANMGPIPQHKGRADFSTAFFNVGAFETIANDGFATVDEAAKATLDSGAKAVVICSTDATYPEIVPDLAKQIKAADPGIMIILAGYPKDHIEAFKEAGVDEFLHVRVNALDLLSKLQKHLEVIA
ncbi:acyl-CoA mutase large subunit family protein [Desulfobulbus rhabdoformis]|uniref:methylmalonyl-CoA mutase family protein n=1 Tax=Desulfobulbus rhabdoformis TaxID=34032 RepID=UPI0019627C4E|nr:methylmalonyl-CoA mutase family protein [Desulfobulbus rhabdoformis]MBM9614132.1 acyl-CoA mutase large subunit family protein [Desulfobulbus rhabdoformis]